MKIGILEAGGPPPELAQRFGAYADMFRRLLGPAFKFAAYDVQAGAFPLSADGCQAYVISGSSSGVYDDDPWIANLQTFVQETAGVTPMLGICFGHQLMAQAFGGKVIKSPKGWGLGQHHYDIKVKTPWMDKGDGLTLPVSHQDQVVEIGPDARVLAASDFTPYAMLDYRPMRALSLQAHPEFGADYAAALIELRRGDRFDAATADAAVASLKASNDRQRVAVWLRRFLTTA